MGNFDVEKTIVVSDSGGSGNNFLAGMLPSACQSKGLDANAVMALCGNRNGSFGNGDQSRRAIPDSPSPGSLLLNSSHPGCPPLSSCQNSPHPGSRALSWRSFRRFLKSF